MHTVPSQGIFNEDAKETMQEKIKRMLVTEASRMEV